jgi:undecaprenyl-diphosphatase
MTTFHAAFWGLLQGLTEFLPVSSSGHLVLAPWLVGWPAPDLAFDLMVHLGTLVAIVVVMRRDVADLLAAAWRLARQRRVVDAKERLVVLIVVSAIPAALLGALASDAIEAALQAPWAVSLLLAATGAILFLSDRLALRGRSLDALRPRDALLIGLAQAAALLPGISRSGATIAGGLMRGLSRREAARFSFLMVLPVIAGASLVQLLRVLRDGLSATVAVNLGVGFLVAAASGYAALSFLLRHLQTRSLRPFAYYCWGLALLGLAVSLLR